VPDVQPPHVVVLDGSPVYAAVYGSLFAAEGYRVSTVIDCAVAPSRVLGLLPDLVVLDLRCGGGLRGLDFLRRLREEPGGRGLPVIASTPSSLLDAGWYAAEVHALDAAIFDGFDQFDDMLVAARAATFRAGGAVWQALGDSSTSPLSD
jgi:CheY-like chemotaxis protein